MTNTNVVDIGKVEMIHTADSTKTFVASAIVSELQSSEMYLTVKARICDLKANLNGVKVTEAFISQIVENQDKYIGIPLCADVQGLISNRTIGHMFDAKTGQFHSSMIGSFYHFEKQYVADNCFLVGYARIMKRNHAICKALSELFATNELKFSFEINCGDYYEDSDGIITIDANENNYLEGTAVVTFPACEDAVALQLVAECLGKGDENMEVIENTQTAEVVENNTEVVAENANTESAETVQNENVVAEETIVSEDKTETEQPIKEQTAENAQSVQSAECNCDSDEKKDDNVEEQTAQTTDKKEEPVEQTSVEEDKPEEQDASCKKKAQIETPTQSIETAEVVNYTAQIAELRKAIETLTAEISELKNQNTTVIAEQQNKVVNPFMAEISIPKKYSLLQKDTKSETVTNFNLLEKV